MYKNKIRLDNSRAVQRLLARTINMLQDDKITESKARTTGYLCNIMLNCCETVDLEERVTALEKDLNNKKVS